MAGRERHDGTPAACALFAAVVLAAGAFLLPRSHRAMDAAFAAPPGRCLIRAGFRLGLFERYRRHLCASSLKQIPHTSAAEAPRYGEGPRGRSLPRCNSP